MSTGLRESKRLTTRAALTQGALLLAQERGYDGFTIADLVDHIGVSRRTFSNYFASKAECLAACSDRWMDAAMELVDAAPDDMLLPDLLRKVIDDLADHLASTGAQFLQLAAVEPEVAAALAAMDAARSVRIAAVITARTALACEDIRVALLADFCLAAGRACTSRWFARGQEGGRAGLARSLDLAFSLIDVRRLSLPIAAD